MPIDAIDDVKKASGKSPPAFSPSAMLSNPDTNSTASTNPLKLSQDLLQSFGELLSAVGPLLSAIAPLLQGNQGPGSKDCGAAGHSLAKGLAKPAAASPHSAGGDAATEPSVPAPPAPPAASPATPAASPATPPASPTPSAASPATPPAPPTPSAAKTAASPPDPGAGTGKPADAAASPAKAPSAATPEASTAAPDAAFKWGSTVDPTPKQVAEKYRSEIMEASKASGIPAKVLAGMIWDESKGKADTPNGGLMQIAPNEFQAHGGGDISNPRDNIMAGAMYLKDLMKPYGDNIRAGLRAYNSGADGVDINDLDSVPPGKRGTEGFPSHVLAAGEKSGI